MGFFNWDGTKSLTGSFCGALWEVDGLTSGGRSGRESLESLNDSKSAKIFYVTSVAFESKDDPTQMTKIVIYNYILYYIQKTIHSKLICTNVHS